MSPITHALLSWVVANAPSETSRRERVIVTIGGLAPDLDGLGAIPDTATKLLLGPDRATSYFHEYHHLLHTLPFAVVATGVAAALAPAKARLRTTALFFVTFHLHLLCDLAGSKGPDGSQWEIPYLWPLAGWDKHAGPQLAWSGQWELNAWPNVALTLALVVAMGVFAVKAGRTILEVLSLRADAAVVKTLRARFGGAPEAAPAQAAPAQDRPAKDAPPGGA